MTSVGAVVIGRNEGDRLIACLKSLQGKVTRLVYVDSGSSDGSQNAARDLGAEVIELDKETPFTAARARNVGAEHLIKEADRPSFIQFVDGDCTVDPDWIETAFAFLLTNPEAAVACGRRRERNPQASVFNRLIDYEWNTPIGQVRSCGGDALMRTDAFESVGGFNPGLIAGEEPELCVRLRAAGWTIHRIDAEMTLHDAQLTRIGQWWSRAKRAGHAYAEGAALHGAAPERHNVKQLQRAVLWGGVLPGLTLISAAIWLPLTMGLLLIWPVQIVRLFIRYGDLAQALAMTFSKLPEAQGVVTYWWRRLTGARARLIEYK
ncbi:MAG: glycosyltransferase [Pseudomonadota bacterium]